MSNTPSGAVTTHSTDSTTPAMKRLLMRSVADGQLRLFDVQLAETIVEINGNPDPLLLLAIALCSYGVGQGDTCLSLSHCAQFEIFSTPADDDKLDLASAAGLQCTRRADAGYIRPPAADAWCQQLMMQSVVACVSKDPAINDNDQENGVEGVSGAGSHDNPGTAAAPLVLSNNDTLYLGRYYELEQRLLERLRFFVSRPGRLMSAVPMAGDQKVSDALQKLSQFLELIFEQGVSPDWQRVAAAVGSTSQLSIVTGGPGTGKTYTVAALLACVAMQHDSEKRPRIALAAPTGKAATRLTESIRDACTRMQVPEDVKAYLNLEAKTLHRLLAIVPGDVFPRYHRGRRLPYDMVVVDEASMVDLPMMSRLFDALHDHASIVLLGDKNQLSSVESGMVLGDICGTRNSTVFDSSLSQAIASVTGQSVPSSDDLAPIANNIVYLTRSYRSKDNGGISALASSINAGNVKDTLACLQSAEYANVKLAAPGDFTELLGTEVLPHYRDLPRTALAADSDDIGEALSVLGKVCVLCALRRGRYGADGVNETLKKLIGTSEPGYGVAQSGPQYAGRPIMIRENNVPMRLFNGDTGLVLRTQTDDNTGMLSVFFPGTAGDSDQSAYRSFATARMPQHDTAYAMTIHKSQGSEFDSVIVVLPEEDSPLLSRELLYTAVTRAKKNIVVVASESILATCVSRKAVRQSGLRGALWPQQTSPADVTFGNEPVVAAESMVEDKTAERAVEEASDVSLSETPVAVSEPGIAELAISESVATEPVIAEQFALDSADTPRQKKRKRASRKAPQASDKPTPVQGSFDF